MKAVKSVIVSLENSDLARRLRKEVADVEFVVSSEARGNELLAIVDGDLFQVPESAQLVVRVGAGPQSGNGGDVCVTLSSLEEAPEAWMRCFDEIVARRMEVSSLSDKLEISRSIEDLLATRDLESVFEKVSATAATVAGFESVTLLFYDSGEERYSISFSNDSEMVDTGEYLPGVPEELLQDAMESHSDFGYEPASESKSGMLVIPLRSEEDAVGVLSLRIPAGEMIDAQRVARAARFLKGVTLLVSTAFHLTRSNELAMKDDLTRAFNRRFFESYLTQEIERGVRYGTIFSIIFLDLDELKKVNDAYGHISGSKTLQEVAKRILGAVRAIDKVVRFGGDEFCIILPQTDEEQARAVAERVRCAIADRKFQLDESVEIEITASFGIASFPVHAKTKDGLVRKADDAMYRVKTGSKNAIGIASVG